MASTHPPPAEYHYGERTYTSLQSIVSDPAQLLLDSSVGMSQSSIDGTLDILSASRYPQALMQPYKGSEVPSRKRKADVAGQLYGGIVLTGSAKEASSSSSGEEDPRPAPKKKRATKQDPAGDQEDPIDSKKTRGRPRLDTQDETAADRRRTQIRLAQRAYRHRKETTISALKQKVNALHDTIEQMNKTFLDLHDNIVNAGILTSHYALGQQLKSATQEFVALSKIATMDSDDEDEKIARITNVETEPVEPTINVKRSGEQATRDRSDRTQTAKKSSPRTTRRTNVRGNSHDLSSTDADADVEDISLVSTDRNHHDASDILAAISQTSYIDTSTFSGLNELMQFNVQIPEHNSAFVYPDLMDTLTIERPIKNSHQSHGSYTYSFQETTFARRLHRMCLERGFRNLTNPNIDPNFVKQVFRFTFCFSNPKRMVQRFQEMLKRKAGESLENWNVPFFHIGGAGTHFPRRDEEGMPLYPPNMLSPAKAFGPHPWVQAETPRVETTTQELLDNIGFGGEWYDSHDVEEYLKTKGIYLDGKSSFIEVDPSVLLLLKSSTGNKDGSLASDSSASSRSPLEFNVQTPSPMVDLVPDSFIVRELGDIYADSNSLGPSVQAPSTTAHSSNPQAVKNQPPSSIFGDANPLDSLNLNIWSNSDFAPQPSPDYTPGAYSDLLGRSRGTVTFDVDMFLERLIESSACLGRAPGFRKSAVDEALTMSVQEVF